MQESGVRMSWTAFATIFFHGSRSSGGRSEVFKASQSLPFPWPFKRNYEICCGLFAACSGLLRKLFAGVDVSSNDAGSTISG